MIDVNNLREGKAYYLLSVSILYNTMIYKKGEEEDRVI